MVFAWVVYLIMMSVISNGEASTNYAFSALFYGLYFGSIATVYALLVIIVLSINKMTLQDNYMKMALLNLASPFFAFILLLSFG